MAASRVWLSGGVENHGLQVILDGEGLCCRGISRDEATFILRAQRGGPLVGPQQGDGLEHYNEGTRALRSQMLPQRRHGYGLCVTWLFSSASSRRPYTKTKNAAVWRTAGSLRTCSCGTARKCRPARQVPFQERTKAPLRTIHGGHLNMAENRTFLLCVDILNPNSGQTHLLLTRQKAEARTLTWFRKLEDAECPTEGILTAALLCAKISATRVEIAIDRQ